MNKAEQKELEVLVTSADPELHDTGLNHLADAYAASGRNADFLSGVIKPYIEPEIPA